MHQQLAQLDGTVRSQDAVGPDDQAAVGTRLDVELGDTHRIALRHRAFNTDSRYDVDSGRSTAAQFRSATIWLRP
ncbi:hypothetical protein KRMM14A1004_30270 [Krasilnikovia sp. MM14-A1004]